MNTQVKLFMLIVLGLISLWDAFTSLWVCHMMVEGNPGYALGAIVAIVSMFILMRTSSIVFVGMEDVQGCMMLLLWAGAFLFDMYSAFVVNEIYLIKPHGETHLFVALVAVTIITSIAPATFSFIKKAI